MTGPVDITENMTFQDERDDVVKHLFASWEEVVFGVISYHSRSLKMEHLKLPGFFVMNYLYRKGPQNLSKLASVTGVSRPTITGIVDKLETHGLVRRIRDTEDRRNIAVELTKTAHSKVKRVYMDSGAIKEELAKRLNDNELRDFVKYMDVLSNIIITFSENLEKNRAEGDLYI